jgi:hypothetical protein
MLLRPFLNDATSCASYLFGCGTHAKLAVVDPDSCLGTGRRNVFVCDARTCHVASEPQAVFVRPPRTACATCLP